MDILFWIFIAIVLLVLYNYYFSKKINYVNQSVEGPLEGFYNQYVGNNAQPKYNQSNNIVNAGNTKTVTDPGQYTQTMNTGAYQAGLISTEPEMQGQSTFDSYAPFDSAVISENKKTGILTEQARFPEQLAVQPATGNCNKRTQLTNVDLLPLDQETTTWAKLNPKPDGWLETKNFLQAGYHLGLNTVGQTKKNANYQLRSEPPNPKDVVSVWNQSQIDPDTRRCFELN